MLSPVNSGRLCFDVRLILLWFYLFPSISILTNYLYITYGEIYILETTTVENFWDGSGLASNSDGYYGEQLLGFGGEKLHERKVQWRRIDLIPSGL
jgi:hypothetical protein